MAVFICPNCGTRTTPAERTAGFSTTPRGCQRCGFGFLFELLDDYYPDPNAAFFVCDREARVIGCGRGSFELTGLKDESTVGRPVKEVLGLSFADDDDPMELLTLTDQVRETIQQTLYKLLSQRGNAFLG